LQATPGTVGQPPTRRTDARRNRERILQTARAAFAVPVAEVSMAEIARRSGVGSATLYRNFPTRRDLLEALLADEVEAVCTAASAPGGDGHGTRLTTWLQRFFQFITSKRPVAVELLEHVDRASPVFGASRERVVAVGTPLLRAAQDAGEVQVGLSLDQILDMIVAISKIPGGPDYVQPILRTALSGLSHPAAC
jgi:AcrR family transcriptional regulator